MTETNGDATAPNRRIRFPILEGILPFDRARVPSDVVAGITLAALGIPEVMGYANIAGMPVITGLYTILIPIAIFAILGSSRHLVVGADSATAAIMAAGLAAMASTATCGQASQADPTLCTNYVSLAGVLAIMTAGILLLARLVKLGFLADFLSRSVLIGFLTGVGIQVAMGQVAGMLGVPKPAGGTVQSFLDTLREIPDLNGATLLVSVGVLGTILVLRRVNDKIPGALIAVIGAIVLSWAVDFEQYGVSILGTVPSGLPAFGFPTFGWDMWQTLLATAAAMFLVILAQSAATSRAYAARFSERFSEDVDLVGLGAANLSAGLSGTFVVNGSPTKSKMVESAGGRSQLSMLVTALIVLVVILFLTVPLSYMPNAVLASIVFLIGLELIDYRGMTRILERRRDEFVIAVITAAVVVGVGVMQGVILAIALSLINHLRFSYRPRDTYEVPGPGGTRTSLPVAGARTPVAATEGLVIYRFAANLYYANSERLTEELRAIAEAGPAPAWICFDAEAVSDVDYTGGEVLNGLIAELSAKGIRFVIASLSDPVREQLQRYGTLDMVGAGSLFATIADSVAAFQANSSDASQGPGEAMPAPST